MSSSADRKRLEPAIPIWGVPVLLVCLLPLGRLLSSGGSQFVLAFGYWQNGLWWGLCAGLVLGTSLWMGRVRSPDLALGIGVFFFLYVGILSQVDYYRESRSLTHRMVQETEADDWPQSWKELGRDALYPAFVASRVTPVGVSWLDHLRAQADVGVMHFEQEGHRRYGGVTGAEVYRQGIWMWWGWLVCYAFLAAGCLVGLAGSALVPRKYPQEVELAPRVRKRVVETLAARGTAHKDIERTLARPSSRHKALTVSAIGTMIPIDDAALSQSILEDLTRAAEWARSKLAHRDLPDDDAARLSTLMSRYYAGEKSRGYQPDHLLLLAADRLQQALGDTPLYACLQTVADITRVHSMFYRLHPFTHVDLTTLAFEPTASGDLWTPLYRGTERFYDLKTAWQLLDDSEPGDIPEDAYLAILHQYIHQPDPRVHEGWWGKRPSEIIEGIAPASRRAILTYLADTEGSHPGDDLHRLQGLAAWCVCWPRADAEPFLECCIQSGWLGALQRVPDDPRWRAFLQRQDPTPFGDASSYVKWFSPAQL